MAIPYPREKARALKAAIEQALKEGYPKEGAKHNQGALAVAATRLGIDRRTAYSLIHNKHAEDAGAIPDWSLYKGTVFKAPEGPQEPADALMTRRLRDEVHRLRSDRADLERRAMEAEEALLDVRGLLKTPPRPKLEIPKLKYGKGENMATILHLSDVHYGEVVDPSEIDYQNSFDADICRARVGRFFAKCASLMTEHWIGKPPVQVHLIIGGDIISGSIHDELLATDLPTVPEQVLEAGELIGGGIKHLASVLKCPIFVEENPGNHGRYTKRPWAKRRARSSFDILACDFAAMACRGIKNVEFHKPRSSDAYFDVLGWKFLANHGDNMGARGGTGYIGPSAPITKGHRKLIDTFQRGARKRVDYVCTGHFHTTMRSPFGFANGSVIGYNEYARDIRADPEPAKQNFLVVHEEHGVIMQRDIFVGDPSEGSLYTKPGEKARKIMD